MPFVGDVEAIWGVHIMNKIFADIFSRQPDEIIEGDYLYHIQWFDDLIVLLEKIEPPEIKERRDFNKKHFKANFKNSWENRTLGNPGYSEYWTWLKSNDLKETMEKITLENIPFMDIASSNGLGLASYIIKMNPKIPCLITDLNAEDNKLLRSCIEEYLPDYNISIAFFNNCEMPIKDNSLDCITSIHGITSSNGELKSWPYPHIRKFHRM